MMDHVTIAVTDLARAHAFYDRALAPLGIERLYADGETASGYGIRPKAFFWIGLRSEVLSGTHIAFRAPDRATVAAFHKAALAAGGRDNGAPGPRADYSPTYYAAFLLDPDGNNVEAVASR